MKKLKYVKAFEDYNESKFTKYIVGADLIKLYLTRI